MVCPTIHRLSVHSACQPRVTRQHTVVRNRRCWRFLDTDDFKADLASSSLVQCPPDDVDELFSACSDTLSSLVDKHAPLRQQRVSTRSRAPWYDAEFRSTKRRTRHLERAYRRRHSSAAHTAWKQQFQLQRRLFRSKAETFWSSAIAECHRDPRKLWCRIGQRLQQQKSQHVHHHSAAEIAAHFTSKVDSVRASTAIASAPVINSRHCRGLTN